MNEPDERQVCQDVTEVLYRYATGIDGRDWALFESCFTDACEADYGTIGRWHSAEEITGWMRQAHEHCGHTLHRITNPTVRVHPEGVTARCYVDAVVMGADNRSGTRAVGFYDDELVATGNGWRIARRRFTMAVLQLLPESELIQRDPQVGSRQEEIR